MTVSLLLKPSHAHPHESFETDDPKVTPTATVSGEVALRHVDVSDGRRTAESLLAIKAREISHVIIKRNLGLERLPLSRGGLDFGVF